MAFYYAYAPLPSDPPSSGHPDPRSSSDEQFHHTRLPSPYNARLPPGYAAYAPPTYAETMRSGPDPTSRPEPLAGLWNEPTSRTPLSPIVVLVRSEGGNDDEADVDTASAATLCGVPLGLLFFVGGFFLTPLCWWMAICVLPRAYTRSEHHWLRMNKLAAWISLGLAMASAVIMAALVVSSHVTLTR